jgi:hypothetical protein
VARPYRTVMSRPKTSVPFQAKSQARRAFCAIAYRGVQ